MKKKSNFLNLNSKDILKGAFIAGLMAILTGVYQAIEANSFPSDWNSWKVILISGIGSFIAYLIKNFLTNSNDIILRKDTND